MNFLHGKCLCVLSMGTGFLWGFPAMANCSVTAATSPSPIAYGIYASKAVVPGDLSPNAAGVDATFNVSCSVVLNLSLLGTSSWLRYTAMQPMVLTKGSETIPYVIASNATFNPVISSVGQAIGGPTGFQLLSLIVLASGQIQVPLHIKTLPMLYWPGAGTYTSNQVLSVDGTICTGLGIGGICLGTSPVNGSVTASMNLVVSKMCEFATTSSLVDFGSVSFLEQASTMQLQVSLRCNAQEDYLLYADNGNHYLNGDRYMVSAGGERIRYQVLNPGNNSQVLEQASPLSRIATGYTENLQIPVVIPSGQATPHAGIYTDNVRMVIEY